ncbi:MAG TPA: NUDIX hydrolase [Chryseolinea sp.]|nr:NUDIX hydrolase [Chryseolinea sp.]
MSEELSHIYGKRLRVRVCGLLHDDERLLLVNHRLPGRSAWWAPPGGGIEFGESLEHTLKREFEEETMLKITVGQFAFGCEFLHEPLHAIELFFWVTRIGGTLQTGQDPELPLITDVRFMPAHEIAALPRDTLHGILHIAPTQIDLQQLKGFFRI